MLAPEAVPDPVSEPVADWDAVAADDTEDDCEPELPCDADCELVELWLDDGVCDSVLAALGD